nr:MAG TPA: hypothetical protein [Crassvirales sp.]
MACERIPEAPLIRFNQWSTSFLSCPLLIYHLQ